jgi:hypothetical protein
MGIRWVAVAPVAVDTGMGGYGAGGEGEGEAVGGVRAGVMELSVVLRVPTTCVKSLPSSCAGRGGLRWSCIVSTATARSLACGARDGEGRTRTRSTDGCSSSAPR